MKPKVLLVSHDAGGAEILCAWYKREQKGYRGFFALEGPALAIFRRDLGTDLYLSGLDLMNEFGDRDLVLTGTSLESSLERSAMQMARERGVRCVSFLDHWDLYIARFRDGQTGCPRFPDEIWVGDDYAYDYALKEGLPKNLLRRVDNPYFQVVRKLKAGAELKAPDTRILFICEPFSRKLLATFGNGAGQYDDELVNINHFLWAALSHRERIEAITLRLHPAEDQTKYEEVVKGFRDRLPLAYSRESSLVRDITRHSHVVGIESMALVIGIILEKKVISCVTGKPWQISLPHHEIIKISDYNLLFGM